MRFDFFEGASRRAFGGNVRRFLMVAAAALLALAGCDKTDEEASATSAAPAALMQLAFPGWAPDGPQSVREITSPPGKTATGAAIPAESMTYALAPQQVVELAADRVLLVVVGVPANAQGGPMAGHSSTALLGACWFERRQGRWFKVAAQPEFAQEGFFGDPGDIRKVDLGGGRLALAVENGSCWQGSCGRWLALYGIGTNRVDKLFGDLIGSDSQDSTPSCGDLLKLAVGARQRVGLEQYSTNYGCHALLGQWQIVPAGAGPGQLVIAFSGKQTSEDKVPVLPPTQVTAGASDDEATEEYLVTVHAVRQKQVYRYREGSYVLVSGKNPCPPL